MLCTDQTEGKFIAGIFERKNYEVIRSAERSALK